MIRKLLVATLAAVVATTMTGQMALAAAPPSVQGESTAAVQAAAALIAAASAAAPEAPAPAPAAAPSPTDPTKIPHYFGPYPNWANSPQTLSDAIVTVAPPAPVFWNPLIGRLYGTDLVAPLGAPGGHIMVVLPQTKLPRGTLNSFQTWNQRGTGQRVSAGQSFYGYVLRPTGTANQYTVVYVSAMLTVPISSSTTGEVATFPLPTPVAVEQNDVIGFYGAGVPFDLGTVNPDLMGYPVYVSPPAPGSTFAFGAAGSQFPIWRESRTYSFAATVTPAVPIVAAEATATVEPKTGGITAITVTSPGSGYTAIPTVTITSPGVTPISPAAATAVISQGVISSIAVNEAGFGFSKPAVTISGGNPTPGFAATAVASGGVDNVTIDPGGGGVYEVQPIVQFSLPDLPNGVQATGTATMIPLDPAAVPNPTFTINAVSVVDSGSGYTSAPTVTITDGTLTQVAPTPAATTATIGIARIDITSGGQGYTSAPTVAINDTVGTPDKGASATATVAVLGAVTGITVTRAGSGYLTPGLKKFVDTLPGTTEATKNDLGQYIPTAVPDTTTYPGTDYYEIAVVQYRMKFHRDLPATLLRGYVQLSTSVVPGKKVALTNANLDPAGAAAPIATYTGVDDPHYLGPTIVATKNRPVRVLFRNLLPTGTGGDLFLPVDTSLMGSGAGPDMMKLDANGVPIDMAADTGSVLDGVRNPMCAQDPKPATCYSENRATMHLHGGVTPWISDGTPHQWETPAGEATAYPKGCQRQKRAGHARSRPWRADFLLHQSAECQADVDARPLVGHHPAERLRR